MPRMQKSWQKCPLIVPLVVVEYSFDDDEVISSYYTLWHRLVKSKRGSFLSLFPHIPHLLAYVFSLSLSSEFYYKFDLALFIYSMTAPMCTYIDRNPLFLFSFLPPFHQLLVVCTLIFVQMDEGTKRETTVARSKSLCDEWRSNARHKVHSLAYAGTKERKKGKIHDETLMSVLVFFSWIRNSRARVSQLDGRWLVSRSHRGHCGRRNPISKMMGATLVRTPMSTQK